MIHLTVKEFLRSQHETDGLTSSLLVDPEHGSLQLALVCLRCIATNVEPLVDLESEAARIEWDLDIDALNSCTAGAPLFKYAAFSWLEHLIDCKVNNIVEISETLTPQQLIFVSKCTWFRNLTAQYA